MAKKPLGEDSCYHVCVDSVIDLATKAINPKRVLGTKKLTAGQLTEFLKMAEITWLELSYVLHLDALKVPKWLAVPELADKLHQQFLEVLTIYGMGYSSHGIPAVFNLWMRRERDDMGHVSPLTLLSAPMGRKMVADWIRQEQWSRMSRRLPVFNVSTHVDRA